MPTVTEFPFTIPFDISEKIAFQYCLNPRKDLPTKGQVDHYQFIIVDDWFCYPDFQNYYGPSNLAHVIRFVEIIEELYDESKKIICVRTSPISMQRSNVAFLISSYMFLKCKMSVDEICEKMKGIYETVLDYRTEGEGPCDHSVSIRDCLLGLQMAFVHHPSLKLSEFDVENLLFMEQPQNGDLNWILPGKVLALAGPTEQNWPITKFIKYAQNHSIGCMVRLNRAHYSAEALIKAGNIEHVEMFMHDGTNPTPENIRDFINIVDRVNGKDLAVAVHCRAGLGRTGTMIAAYLLFKYARDFETNQQNHLETCPCSHLRPPEIARAIIGFLRIMRPGSVLSGQPEFLESISEIVMNAGRAGSPEFIKSFDSEVTESEIQIFAEEAAVVQVRYSKRLKMSSESLRQLSKHHPISHAGRGHAAEKHSTVQIEKF